MFFRGVLYCKAAIAILPTNLGGDFFSSCLRRVSNEMLQTRITFVQQSQTFRLSLNMKVLSDLAPNSWILAKITVSYYNPHRAPLPTPTPSSKKIAKRTKLRATAPEVSLGQMFSVHTKPEEFKSATITGHSGFVFEENSVREVT